jgi:uncharacterized protein with beta-barrel porin domain
MQRVTYGLEPSTHRGVVHLLGDHFVKTGVLSAELGRLVSRMQRDREDAGAGIDTGGGQLDTGGTKVDSGGTKVDSGGTKVDSGGTKVDAGTGYSVTICTSSAACKSGETCLIPFWDHTKGICTETCTSNTQCASAERAKYGLAQMCVSGSVTKGGTTTNWQACAYVCKDEFGKTYSCPSGTTCVVSNPNQSMCDPPQ